MSSPMICPRASSAYLAMPTSYGIRAAVSSCSVFPTIEISGTL